MRQEHRAGEKLFVDFSGKKLPIVNPHTGVIMPAELFVAVLSASSYTYAEAFASQQMPYWIAAHIHTFEFMGSCPQILVCDNLRAGVTRSHRNEPDINATYLEMAAHYGCAVIPSRSYKPRGNAKAEAGVLVAQRWILAALRNQTWLELLRIPVGGLTPRSPARWCLARRSLRCKADDATASRRGCPRAGCRPLARLVHGPFSRTSQR
jgi:transposase